MKPRVYTDTSVIGGCEDEEFSEWSFKLIEEFRCGLKIIVISDLTRQELEEAPEPVQKILSSISNANIENVDLAEESVNLASYYIEASVVTAKYTADAQHIAITTIERADVLVSWNFQHIVNLNRIHGFNSVNLRLGYPMLEIRTPREVIDE